MSGATAQDGTEIHVPMRDDVILAADLYLPDGHGDGPFPTLLRRTPYGKRELDFPEEAAFFAGHGYAVVEQDVRGRGASHGDWYPFVNEGRDGFDTIEWIAAQPWCDDRVGTIGGSYSGWTQWDAAREQPPHLAAMASTSSGGRWMRELPWDNGVLALMVLPWLCGTSGFVPEEIAAVDWEKIFHHRPVRTMDELVGRDLLAWRDWVDHPALDDYWRPLLFDRQDFAGIDVPVLHIAGWYDADQPGALFFYEGMMRHSPAAARQQILLGPWEHGEEGQRHIIGGVDFSPAALMDMQDVRRRWFDRWLKKDEQGHAPASRFFVTGINEWRESQQWPPTNVEARSWFLHSEGRANTLAGDGSLSTSPPAAGSGDTFVYDPDDPVVTLPTVNPFLLDDDPPLDHSYLGPREDVLFYTGAEVEDALTVIGRPWILLHASSDAPDTDWFASVHDVHPDGRSVLVCAGRMRARFRGSLEIEELMDPGRVYEFGFELRSVAHTFRPGHRIRLLVTSSDFPMYDRNPNTGHPIGQDSAIRTARNTVHHSPAHPSRLILPVLRTS